MRASAILPARALCCAWKVLNGIRAATCLPTKMNMLPMKSVGCMMENGLLDPTTAAVWVCVGSVSVWLWLPDASTVIVCVWEPAVDVVVVVDASRLSSLSPLPSASILVFSPYCTVLATVWLCAPSVDADAVWLCVPAAARVMPVAELAMACV